MAIIWMLFFLDTAGGGRLVGGKMSGCSCLLVLGEYMLVYILWISTGTEIPQCLTPDWVNFMLVSIQTKGCCSAKPLSGCSTLEEEEKAKQAGIPPSELDISMKHSGSKQVIHVHKTLLGLSFPPSLCFLPPAAFLSKWTCKEVNGCLHCFACISFHFSCVSLQAGNRQAGIGGGRKLLAVRHPHSVCHYFCVSA